MSDLLASVSDADLGAAWDAAQSNGGTPVIDTGASIKDDNRPRPGHEMKAEMPAQFRHDKRDAINDTLDKTYAWLHSPQKAAFEAHRKPPIPDTLNAEEAYQWGDRPIEERRAGHQAVQEIESMKDAGRKLGIEVKTASDLKAVMEILHGKKNSGDDAPPSEVMRRFAPEARTVAEAEAALVKAAEPYEQFEKDYARDPVGALLRAAHTRGHTSIVDANNPAHAAAVAAHFHGFNLGQLAERAGYIPAERVEAALDEIVADADAKATVEAWKRHNPKVDDALRREMAEILASGSFDGSGDAFEMLDRLLAEAQRARGRPGYTRRGSMDETIRKMGMASGLPDGERRVA